MEAGKLCVCAVFDVKVGVFFQPFFARSRGEALRSFVDQAQQEGHVFQKHPGDFSLFVLASWLEDNGSFENEVPAVNLGTALEHVSRESVPDPAQADLVSLANQA